MHILSKRIFIKSLLILYRIFPVRDEVIEQLKYNVIYPQQVHSSPPSSSTRPHSDCQLAPRKQGWTERRNKSESCFVQMLKSEWLLLCGWVSLVYPYIHMLVLVKLEMSECKCENRTVSPFDYYCVKKKKISPVIVLEVTEQSTWHLIEMVFFHS